jgi:NAD(P)-dependent dehydrogenase (short-subunit alcohol dehydrogenase family)
MSQTASATVPSTPFGFAALQNRTVVIIGGTSGIRTRLRGLARREAALANIPHVDHLVLLAGTFVAGKIMDADVDYLRRAFDERIWALGDRLALDGSITLISGALADRPNAYGTAILAAASAAMEGFARGLALELAPRRVNTLSPGTTDTPLLNRTLGDGRDAYVAALKEKLPLRRLGTPDEVGAAVVFLMSNGFMNGETLHIDGGARLV